MWPLQPKLGDADRLPAWVQREPETPVNGDRAADQTDTKAEEARLQDSASGTSPPALRGLLILLAAGAVGGALCGQGGERHS